ncbi:MAG: glucose-6-phosphate dehydrogenase, partial [Gemmataceae bacterium]|nr:glucose-6-phosphate dehydrogenase [Gemmataceae bacterium]
FARRLRYVAADATAPGGAKPLADELARIEGGEARRLFYFSVAPELYEPLAAALEESRLAEERSPQAWRRLVIEKPFGKDAASARKLNGAILKRFREEQVFRIDHYLGKETVQNTLAFRFANTLFEPLWNSTYIDHVQITAAETVKVGKRAGYYDKSGVLRDMFQNHLLQVLAIAAMEGPSRFAAGPLRDEKKKLLDAVALPTGDDLATAQYEGYRQEEGVAPGSRTPTYAALKLSIDNWRWRGVPFYLRSGKALNKRFSEVAIQFRCPPHLMFPLPPGTTLQCNRLSILLQPDEGIRINFQSKVPDTERFELRPTGLDFRYKEAYPEAPIPEAYERLLLDALNGDAALFMRSDEIERAWEIIDPVVQASEEREPETYAAGSDGPKGADALLAKDGKAWM